MRLNSSSVVAKVAIVATLGFALTRILPSLADTNTPDPTVTDQPVASASPTPGPTVSATTASPSPTGSSAPAPVASPSVTYLTPPSGSPTPSPLPTSIQGAHVVVQAPYVIKVDPRSSIVQIAPFDIASSNTVLVCLRTSSGSLAFAPGALQSASTSPAALAISGPAAQVSASLSNSLRLVGAPRVAGASIALQVVAVDGVTTDSSLCGSPNYAQNIAISPLGLELDTVKVPVKLK